MMTKKKWIDSIVFAVLLAAVATTGFSFKTNFNNGQEDRYTSASSHYNYEHIDEIELAYEDIVNALTRFLV